LFISNRGLENHSPDFAKIKVFDQHAQKLKKKLLKVKEDNIQNLQSDGFDKAIDFH